MNAREARLQTLRKAYFPWSPEESTDACNLIRELLDEVAGLRRQRPITDDAGGRRWYAACYRDENGTYNELESATVVREYAEADVKRWKSIEEGEPDGRPDLVVLGTKIEHSWEPVEAAEAAR
jgi:hypothetical protein